LAFLVQYSTFILHFSVRIFRTVSASAFAKASAGQEFFRKSVRFSHQTRKFLEETFENVQKVSENVQKVSENVQKVIGNVRKCSFFLHPPAHLIDFN
jgi:methyl-accepting chemotaxis protein